jgi:hypothetical protein
MARKKARNARYKASNYVGIEIGSKKLEINSGLSDEQIMERLFQLLNHPCNKASKYYFIKRKNEIENKLQSQSSH